MIIDRDSSEDRQRPIRREADEDRNASHERPKEE
jgi:hypothetical protein